MNGIKRIEHNTDMIGNNLNEYTQDLEYSITERINTVIKALGTMVVFPILETNPTTFKKEQVGSSQQPILMDELRAEALEKLRELISKL